MYTTTEEFFQILKNIPSKWQKKFFEQRKDSLLPHTFQDDCEAIQIVSFGIWNHFIQSKQSGWIVPNSGGSDSRVAILLIVNSIKQAWEQLGAEEFKRQVSFVPGAEGCKAYKDFAKLIVFAPYLAGATSGSETEASARILAESTGVTFGRVSIKELEEAANKNIHLGVGKNPNLNWDNKDLLKSNFGAMTALENCPARIRGFLPWQFANLFKLILITTGNQDEIWSKYFTLGGDNEGGLAPLSGVFKPRIFRMQCVLAALLDVTKELHDIILNSVATAELKPAEYEQTDDSECGPFALRYLCCQLIIGEDRNALQAFRMILLEEYGESPSKEEIEIVHFTVRKFVKAVMPNQWSRTQLALGYVVEASDTFPGTDHSNRRAFIDSAYKGWLEELEEYVKQ